MQTTAVGIGVTECFDPSHSYTTLQKLKRKPREILAIITKTNIINQQQCDPLSITQTSVWDNTQNMWIWKEYVQKLLLLPMTNSRYKKKLKFIYYKILLVH